MRKIKSNQIFIYDRRKVTKYIKYTEYRKVQRDQTQKGNNTHTAYMHSQMYKS